MTEPLLDATDVAQLQTMVTPRGAEAEAPERPAPARETEPEETVEGFTAAELREMSARNLEAISDLTRTITEREQRAIERERQTERRPSLADQFSDDEPGLKELALRQERIDGALERIETRLEEEQQHRDYSERVESTALETEQRWTAELNELKQRFPGVSDKDMDRVWEWAEKEPGQASSMSVGMMAEKILGYSFLDERRSPVGRPPSSMTPPPEVPNARLVTDTAAGGGGGSRPAQPQRQGGDVRDAFNDIRSDAAAMASLGKFGR